MVNGSAFAIGCNGMSLSARRLLSNIVWIDIRWKRDDDLKTMHICCGPSVNMSYSRNLTLSEYALFVGWSRTYEIASS